MIEKFLPVFPTKDDDKILIFDEIGIPYKKSYGWVRPLVIFDYYRVNEYEYIKTRTHDINNPNKNTPKPGEILLNPNKNKKNEEGLLRYSSYADCGQIFITKQEIFDPLINFEKNINKYAKPVSKKKILNEMLNHIMTNPPFLSIVEIKVDERGKYYGVSRYLCDEKIEYMKKFKAPNSMTNKVESFYKDVDFSKFRSVYDKNDINSTKRYKYGIDFCVDFLLKNFPNKINQFFENQKLDKKIYFEKNLVVPLNKENKIESNNVNIKKGFERERER